MITNNTIKLKNTNLKEIITIKIQTGYNGLSYIYTIRRDKKRYKVYRCNDSTRLYKFISRLYIHNFK